MTESERIVLGDVGERNSEDSDPVLVTGEASVSGSAGVSAGHSSFSHSTVAPGSSGAFGAPPTAPQAGGGAIRKPRSDTVSTLEWLVGGYSCVVPRGPRKEGGDESPHADILFELASRNPEQNLSFV